MFYVAPGRPHAPNMFMSGQSPVLPFLVFWKTARKTSQRTRMFYSCRTPKIPKRRGKCSKKRNSSQGNKSKELQKKGKEGQGSGSRFALNIKENPSIRKPPKLSRITRCLKSWDLGHRQTCCESRVGTAVDLVSIFRAGTFFCCEIDSYSLLKFF